MHLRSRRLKFAADPAKVATHARPFVYHWIGNLQTLGHVDRNVTADHPTGMVFSRGGQRTYVAFNMTDRPLTVQFSDGAALSVPAGQAATRP